MNSENNIFDLSDIAYDTYNDLKNKLQELLNNKLLWPQTYDGYIIELAKAWQYIQSEQYKKADDIFNSMKKKIGYKEWWNIDTIVTHTKEDLDEMLEVCERCKKLALEQKNSWECNDTLYKFILDDISQIMWLLVCSTYEETMFRFEWVEQLLTMESDKSIKHSKRKKNIESRRRDRKDNF
jgi:hypothetical protein